MAKIADISETGIYNAAKLAGVLGVSHATAKSFLLTGKIVKIEEPIGYYAGEPQYGCLGRAILNFIEKNTRAVEPVRSSAPVIKSPRSHQEMSEKEFHKMIDDI